MLSIFLSVLLLGGACLSAGVPVSAALQTATPADEDGSALWLRYPAVERGAYRDTLARLAGAIAVDEPGQVLATAAAELQEGLASFLGEGPSVTDSLQGPGILLGTPANPAVAAAVGRDRLDTLGAEGFLIRETRLDGRDTLVVAGGGEKGALYGVFRLLEHIQCRRPLEGMELADRPAIQWRVLDQWDNWDGSIERGYAGKSIYDWDALPDTVDGRYAEFARANASIGVNTIVINNVNAQFAYLKTENLPKIAALADVFRRYGVRLALSVRFDSPIGIGGLASADPKNDAVIAWWEDKLEEIYTYIPDFAGVLVKADSEGQPGPSQYGRTHADGANMFAKILEPHDGIVMWRTFVYGAAAEEISSDITLHQYGFFKPLDGRFADNVVVQNKNGPRDFLPMEPVAPLIGGMERTNVGMELQITQEYTGQSTHLCYLVPMWKEYLAFDTKTDSACAHTAQGTTVDKVIDGTVYGRPVSLMAGVANIGADTNWTRLELAQANWYGFGRLAWNPAADGDEITKDWIALTFGQDEETAACIKSLLDHSWEIYQSYVSPYAMGMTMDMEHFSPDLASRNQKGHIAVDGEGVGHNRSAGGSTDLTAQYFPAVRELFGNMDTCPEELLCWFHHVPYDRVMQNGKTMIQSLYDGFYEGAARVTQMREAFAGLKGKIDDARWGRIDKSFAAQETQAVKWRDAMAAFFYQASGVADTGDRRDAASLRKLIERYTAEQPFLTVDRYPQASLAAFTAALADAKAVLDAAPDQPAAKAACAALDSAFDALYRSGGEGEENLVYRKPVRAVVAGSASQVEESHVAADANDGLLSTRVNAVGDIYPMDWTVDLEGVFSLDRVCVDWYDGNNHGDKKRTYTFSLWVSEDGERYTRIFDGDNSADLSHSDLAVEGRGRYLRLTVTSGTVGRPSFWEVRAYGDAVLDRGKLDEVIREAGALSQTDYTFESWAALSEALTAAGGLPDTAGQAVIDEAAAAIRKAIDALQPAVPVPAVVPGDLDGDGKVTIQDVMEACKVLARKTAGREPSADEMERGNLDGDNAFTINDVMAICKILARGA